MSVQYARNMKLLQKRNPFLNLLPKLGCSEISSDIPISDTKPDGQMGSKSGSYFGGLGLKPRLADRLSCLGWMSVEICLASLLLRSSNYAETASLNKPLNVRCSFSLVACDAVYILGRTIWVSGIMVPRTSRLNVMERAEMISSDIWKKDQDWSWEGADREWWLQVTVGGGRRRTNGLEETGRKIVQYNNTNGLDLLFRPEHGVTKFLRNTIYQTARCHN